MHFGLRRRLFTFISNILQNLYFSCSQAFFLRKIDVGGSEYGDSSVVMSIRLRYYNEEEIINGGKLEGRMWTFLEQLSNSTTHETRSQ